MVKSAQRCLYSHGVFDEEVGVEAGKYYTVSGKTEKAKGNQTLIIIHVYLLFVLCSCLKMIVILHIKTWPLRSSFQSNSRLGIDSESQVDWIEDTAKFPPHSSHSSWNERTYEPTNPTNPPKPSPSTTKDTPSSNFRPNTLFHGKSKA